jgi:hypothetical protein
VIISVSWRNPHLSIVFLFKMQNHLTPLAHLVSLLTCFWVERSSQLAHGLFFSSVGKKKEFWQEIPKEKAFYKSSQGDL